MRQGREWELLVAQLEGLFAGPQFEVRSPDSIRSMRTGNIVKVDVTVRGRIGATDVLLAFECRDRNDHQGVDWIQQLATRKTDIGASELIAVSRAGFSSDAIREAAAWGIPLRTLSQAGVEDLASFVLELTVDIHRRRYQARQVDLTRLRLRPFGIDVNNGSWSKFTPAALQSVIEKPGEPQLVDMATGQPVSVLQLVHAADWRAAFTDEPFADRRAFRAIIPNYADESGGLEPRVRYWLDEGRGVDIDGLSFLGEVWWEHENVKLSRVLSYSAQDESLAVIAEFDLSPHGMSGALQVFLGRK